jgi:hypothetical protein
VARRRESRILEEAEPGSALQRHGPFVAIPSEHDLLGRRVDVDFMRSDYDLCCSGTRNPTPIKTPATASRGSARAPGVTDRSQCVMDARCWNIVMRPRRRQEITTMLTGDALFVHRALNAAWAPTREDDVRRDRSRLGKVVTR